MTTRNTLVRVSVLFLVWNGVQVSAQYVLTEISPLVGHEESNAVGINDGQQVAGNSHRTIYDQFGSPIGVERRAFIWRNGEYESVLNLGSISPVAAGMNETGHVVGSTGVRGFIWNGTNIEWLDSLDFCCEGALAINDTMQVAGIWGGLLGFFWDDGEFSSIGYLPPDGWQETIPLAINNTGTVVGYSRAHAQPLEYRAFLWHAGAMLDIGPGRAYAINDNGSVAGTFEEMPGIWEDGSVTPLPSPAEYPGVPLALNNNGVVVGGTAIGLSNSKAIVWLNGVRSELSDLIPTGQELDLLWAEDVNDEGMIVGRAKLRDDSAFARGFLLYPVDPDLDDDGDIDLLDHFLMQGCMTGPPGPVGLECLASDLHRNGNVDLFDVRAFQIRFTGN